MIPRPKRNSGGGNLWIKITDRPQQVTVASPPVWTLGHWDKAARRMRRCGGDLCRLCAIGLESKAWVYVAVHLPTGEMKVMEIHARNHELANEWLLEPDQGIGRVLSVWKRGPARNSPVVLEDIGRSTTGVEDITGFVACLGLDPQFVVDVDLGSESRSVEELVAAKSTIVKEERPATWTEEDARLQELIDRQKRELSP